MNLRRFVQDWRARGLRVALYNQGYLLVHRHDDHVRVWQDGEHCSGCDNCPRRQTPA